MKWVRVTRGAHRLHSVKDTTLAELAAWQTVLPATVAFTHLTAALVYGLRLPPLPVWVRMGRKTAAPVRPGLRVGRHPTSVDTGIVKGLRVVSVPEVLLACARDLSVLDLVVLIDGALHDQLCTLQGLQKHARLRRRGAPRLRRAIALADGRSESAWETVLRILHVTCDVVVEPQYEVRHEGAFVARVDLWLVDTLRAHEYDGGAHLKRPRQRKDLKRSGRLDRAGWSRRGFTREDVLQQGVAILREADEAIDRPHDPRRIRPWHAILKESLFTDAGTTVFRKRVGLLADDQRPDEKRDGLGGI